MKMNKRPSKVHKCPDCGSTFPRPQRLAQHRLLHRDIRTFVCSETDCNKAYSCKSHLDRHIKNVHIQNIQKPSFSCSVCGKIYTNQQNLKRHLIKDHIEGTPYFCDQCYKKFHNDNQLKAHMYQHTGIKSFRCELCTDQFVTSYELSRHRRYHKMYRCSDCLLQFNHWKDFRAHRKEAHAVKNYICDYCTSYFNTREQIVRHIKTHLRKFQSAKLYFCPYDKCERYYTTNSNLKQHVMATHLNIRHQCGICKAGLSTKAKLVYHMQCHYRPQVIINQEDKPLQLNEDGTSERPLSSTSEPAETSTNLTVKSENET